MSQAREAVLAKIQGALRDLKPYEKMDFSNIPRDYRTDDGQSHAERVHQFVENVREYKASVRMVASSELPRAIAQACAARGVKRLVVPADLPDGWAPADVALIREPGLSIDDLDHSGGVLTAAALGIAQTGTIVLDSGPGQGRRAISLVPDYHLCVIRDDQVVGLVPEAIARLQAAAARPDRPITFISGPSATSDIELSRVEGVHGPRTLEVLVVTSLVDRSETSKS
ncbi:MAG: lactate utilization protein C [Planctomycetaceae bacterium]|nr:lactate utilization protein C [Planctomycetaceae bacterium]